MIPERNKYLAFLLLASVILSTSCNNNVVFTGSEAMNGNVWVLNHVPSFDVNVTDTITSNNVIFTIRTGSSYPFRNIFLFVKTTSPDGKSITDTLQYNLADEKGTWLGKGFGDIKELDLTYKSNVYFPVKGIYNFNIQHGMRAEDLVGVYDFGIRVEKIVK
jgi:gliding motility-associated lipoprotein GldH